MLKAVERYLALRRAAGFAMQTAEYLLKSCARFATERGETHVRTQTAIDCVNAVDNDEAPTPDTNMRRLTSERTLTPAAISCAAVLAAIKARPFGRHVPRRP